MVWLGYSEPMRDGADARLGTLGLSTLKKGERVKSYWKPDTTVRVNGEESYLQNYQATNT